MFVFGHVTPYFLGEWVPRGNFEGVTNIVTGENILGGIGEVVLNTAGDALGGVGAGALVSNTAKGAAKEGSKVAIKEALKKQAAQEAAKVFVPVVAMANGYKSQSFLSTLPFQFLHFRRFNNKDFFLFFFLINI